MTSVAKRRDKVKKFLRKEIDLPISKDPKPGKLNQFFHKKRSIVPKYFVNSWRELKKVNWPNRKESWQLVLAVILFTALFTVITVAADYVFNEIVERIIL